MYFNAFSGFLFVIGRYSDLVKMKIMEETLWKSNNGLSKINIGLN